MIDAKSPSAFCPLSFILNMNDDEDLKFLELITCGKVKKDDIGKNSKLLPELWVRISEKDSLISSKLKTEVLLEDKNEIVSAYRDIVISPEFYDFYHKLINFIKNNPEKSVFSKNFDLTDLKKIIEICYYYKKDDFFSVKQKDAIYSEFLTSNNKAFISLMEDESTVKFVREYAKDPVAKKIYIDKKKVPYVTSGYLCEWEATILTNADLMGEGLFLKRNIAKLKDGDAAYYLWLERFRDKSRESMEKDFSGGLKPSVILKESSLLSYSNIFKEIFKRGFKNKSDLEMII